MDHPKAAPTSPLGWIEATLSWLWVNVFWGLIAILIGALTPLLGGGSPQLTNDTLLAITVLALTLCGTQLEFPADLSLKQEIQRRWIGRFAYLVLLVGAILAFANSDPNPIINSAAIRPDIMRNLSLALFFFALVLAFISFILRSLAQDEYLVRLFQGVRDEGSYDKNLVERQQTVITDAQSTDQVGDLRI